MRDEAISLLLGYLSIGSWLGAQFPQIIVNWKRKSVDGLALPFLANWLLGDTSNLIGCLLTDQLPFQTYLACYFVFVDICLVSQFLYYYAPRHVKSLAILTSPSALQSRTSLIQHSPETYSSRRARSSRSRSASHSFDPRPRSAIGNMTLTPSELDSRHRESLASEMDVYGSQRRWRSRGSWPGNSMEGLPESVVADYHEHEWGGRRLTSLERDPEDEAADAESESSPSVMVDSFHSEGGNRSRGRGKRVSWTQESPVRETSTRRDPLVDDPGPSTTPSTMRGRQLTRPDGYDAIDGAEAPLVEAQLPRARRTSAASAVSAAASRRSASIVFLAIFALFSWSPYSDMRRSAGPEGRVLTISPVSPGHTMIIPDMSSTSSLSTPSTPIFFVSPPDASLRLSGNEPYISADENTQRFVGRVSAWTCTTLYLTSRLPQIWKNFVRKSVEGLSMYLFIFAFLGNFFYVLSILTSSKMDLPAPLARQFIRDSIPFLLGSGGTLVFDITIVFQSFIYDPRRRVMRGRVRRKSLGPVGGEEQRLLLSTGVEEAC